MAITVRANATVLNQAKPGVATDFDITTTGNVIAGDHVYIGVCGWQGGGTNGALIASIADDQGGSWSQIATIRRTANNHVASLWRGTGASGGAALTATLTYDETGAAGQHTAIIVSVGGMATAAVDDFATNEDSSGSTMTSGSITTTVNDALVLAFGFALDNNPNSLSTPTGYTLIGENEASYESCSFVYKILSSTATESATWTLGGTSPNPLSIIADFEGTSSGGGGGATQTLTLLGIG
jgi:hypothetical protein